MPNRLQILCIRDLKRAQRPPQPVRPAMRQGQRAPEQQHHVMQQPPMMMAPAQPFMQQHTPPAFNPNAAAQGPYMNPACAQAGGRDKAACCAVRRPRGCDFSVSAASSRTPEIHVVQILEQQARDADFPFEDLEEAQLMSALGSLTLEDHSCMTDEEIPPRRRLQANKQQISLYFPGRLKRAL